MVTTRFWSDSFIVDQLNALDRYLFLYLLTNERSNIIGIYELSLRTASFETGIDKDDLVKMLGRLSPKVEYFDGWVYIQKFADHQTTSPKVELGMEREVRELPAAVREKIKKIGFASARLQLIFDSVTNRMAEKVDGIDTVSDGMDTTSHLTITKPNLTKTITKPKNGNTTDAPKRPPVKTKDIDDLFLLWETEVDYPITSQLKTNRQYASKIIQEFPPGDIRPMLKVVALSQDDQYAPRVSNFIQLYRKWDDLKGWVRRKKAGDTAGKARSFKL